MRSLSSLIFGLALAVGAAHTAEALCHIPEGFTVSHVAELDGLSGCPIIHGTLRLSRFDSDTVYLWGVRAIDGHLVIEDNFSLRQVVLPDLQQVSGEIRLHHNTQLKELSTPHLRAVGHFTAEVNPVLSDIGFPAGLSTIGNFRLIDSMVRRVPGLNMTEAGEIQIAANRYLGDIHFDALRNITGRLLITDNERNSSLRAPLLHTIDGNVTMTHLSDIALPSLMLLGNGLNLHQNSLHELHMDRLSSITQSLTVTENELLEGVSFHALEVIGGALRFNDNPALHSITGFPSLRSVLGTVEVTGGPLEEVRFDVLQDVAGAAKIETTSKADCRSGKLVGFSPKVVQGLFDCKVGVKASSGDGKGHNGRGLDSGAGSMRDAAMTSSSVVVSIAILAVFASCLLG